MLLGLLLKKKLSNNLREFSFFYPGNINQKTGGFIYEKNILQYSKKNKIHVKFIELSNNFPNPKKIDLIYLNNLINITKYSKILILHSCNFQSSFL